MKVDLGRKMKNRTTKQMLLLIKRWFTRVPNAVLCQRDKELGITFIPTRIETVNVEDGIIRAWLPKSQVDSLHQSKYLFKTVTIVSHRSTRSDPTRNKGFFLILSIVSWKEDVLPKNVPVEELWPKEKEFVKVSLQPLRGSFWAGTKFGSFKWQSMPKNIPKGFNKPRYLPAWGRSRKLRKEEIDILSKCQFLFIAILTKQGTIHVTPVDFVAVKNRVILATSLFSAKMRHFIRTWTAVAYTYPTHYDSIHGDFSKALTIRGRPFVYGWNPILALFYGFLFSPYLVLVTAWMRRKYPNTIRNFPKQTNFRWRFIPIVGRTFLDINWEN